MLGAAMPLTLALVTRAHASRHSPFVSPPQALSGEENYRFKQQVPTITRRQVASTSLETCGYQDGDPNRPRSAELGFECRTDTDIGIWGFCATTVTIASNCGMAGACFDSHACSSGCGLINYGTRVTTFSCNDSGQNSVCSTALMIPNQDQTYSFIDCGRSAVVETYFVNPTTTLPTSTTSATSSTSSPTSTAPVSSPASPSSTSSSLAPIETSQIPASSTSTADSSGTGSSNKGSNNTGTIAGSVIGGVAIICITILAIFIIRRRHRNRQNNEVAATFIDNHQYQVPQYTDAHPVVEADVQPKQYREVGTKPIELPGSAARQNRS